MEPIYDFHELIIVLSLLRQIILIKVERINDSTHSCQKSIAPKTHRRIVIQLTILFLNLLQNNHLSMLTLKLPVKEKRV